MLSVFGFDDDEFIKKYIFLLSKSKIEANLKLRHKCNSNLYFYNNP